MRYLKERFPIFKTNPFLATFSSIAFGVFVLGSFMFTFRYMLPDTQVAEAAEMGQEAVDGAPIQEVHIANNGMVYIQGAKVLSVSDTTIVVYTFWGNTKFKWTVLTDGIKYGPRYFGTDFFDAKGNRISVKDIQVGSFITVNGTFDTTYSDPTLKADVVRM